MSYDVTQSCPLCNDTGRLFKKVDEVLKPFNCKCSQYKRMYGYLSKYLYQDFELPDKKDPTKMYNIESFINKTNLYIKVSDPDKLRSGIGGVLFKQKRPPYLFLNTIDIVNAYVGESPKFENIASIPLQAQAFFITLGYEDMKNVALGECLMYLLYNIEQYDNKYYWIISKYSPGDSHIKTKYGEDIMNRLKKLKYYDLKK